jgi:hypothetical protein
MPNYEGTRRGNLIPGQHGATPPNLKHGAYSKDGRALEPRAREIAEGILQTPHTIELDEIGSSRSAVWRR